MYGSTDEEVGMIAVLQRVSQASVTVDDRDVARIGRGLLVLFAVCEGDTRQEMEFICDKLTDLRIFPDAEGRMNISLQDSGGSLLIVSQFTLCAEWVRGRRPGFTRAAAPDLAEKLYNEAVGYLREKSIDVQTGIFAADMKVGLINDGPVTLILDSREKFRKEA